MNGRGEKRWAGCRYRGSRRDSSGCGFPCADEGKRGARDVAIGVFGVIVVAVVSHARTRGKEVRGMLL